MKKGSFVIQLVPGAKEKFEVVNGWIDDNCEYGYRKNSKNKWECTDIKSGMLICTQSTRKECVAFVERLAVQILEAKREQVYFDAVEAMRQYCEEQLKGESNES